MTITIPVDGGTWEKARRFLDDAGPVATSAYWETRRHELQYRPVAGAVECSGLYAPILPAPTWIDPFPGPIARVRKALSRRSPKYWTMHPLLLRWCEIEAEIDPRLTAIFSAYDLVKAYETAEILLAHRPTHVLEIGAGACLVGAFLLSGMPGLRYTVVDIPETIPLGMLTLRHIFPDMAIGLPGEDGQVRFHTPDKLPEGPFDAAVNVTSFQELTPDIVAGYFAFIERTVKGVFICVNRAEKETRFADYPWPAWEILRDDEPLISRWSGPDTVARRRVLISRP